MLLVQGRAGEQGHGAGNGKTSRLFLCSHLVLARYRHSYTETDTSSYSLRKQLISFYIRLLCFLFLCSIQGGASTVSNLLTPLPSLGGAMKGTSTRYFQLEHLSSSNRAISRKYQHRDVVVGRVLFPAFRWSSGKRLDVNV